jgi:3-ketoacyl-CoA synthase
MHNHAMDVAQKEYLLSAFHRALGVVTLLTCLLTEASIFVSERHAAMYLIPLCSILLLFGHCRSRAGSTSISLVDFCCLKPPPRLRTPIPKFVEHIKLGGCFEDDAVEFMAKAVVASGMGHETYFPPSLHQIPPDATHANAMEEARMLLYPALDELFTKTGVPPSAVGAVIVNCSGFCPAPSLAAMVANRYRMRSDIKTFNVSGMGCSAGVVGVDVARSILVTHPTISYAVVASTEVITVGWYNGRYHSKLLLNCTFRNGCSAALLTNGRRGGMAAKYRLVRLARTNLIANDDGYRSGYREEDDEGITGFNVARGVGSAFEEVLRAHLATLGTSVLPWPEKLRYATALLLSLLRKTRTPGYLVPNFGKAAEHFCLPTTWAPMIRRLGQGIGLGEKQMEAALMTYHRFGNQSAASLWYQLAYHEAKGIVRKGDKVWQLGVGTGLKVNSVVWERVAADEDKDGARPENRVGVGPWMNCIHRYPVRE